MAFLIYKRIAAGPLVRFEKLQPLKLGGSDGLIARHVKSLPDAETQSWRLEARALLAFAGHSGAGDELVVLFHVTGRDTTTACLYELKRIHGSCRGTSTQQALDFAVLVDQEADGDAAEFAKCFEVPAGQSHKRFSETLALSGGPAGSDWKWSNTALNLGATVVQAQSAGS